jgi:CDP-2,3-bis-(O-geranylgeranyl)-sn-glycerol synthase
MNVLLVFYLMIPAYIANMVPVFVKKIPWKTPMDFGLSFGKKRLLGNNKTWKGFVFGVLIGTAVMYFLSLAYWPFDFSVLHWSILASAGALLGDCVESFFKRRSNIGPGKPWIPFDQLDYSVGALVLGSFVFFPGWLNAFIVVFVGVAGHILVNHIGYFLGLQKVKW